MITGSTSDKTFDFRCLSTDEKPIIFNGIEIDNGSQLLEMDTGDIYLFDKQNQMWRKFV